MSRLLRRHVDPVVSDALADTRVVAVVGAARILGLRGLPDALVGRMETVELWPFSQGEIEQIDEDFIDRVFEDDPGVRRVGRDPRGLPRAPRAWRIPGGRAA